MLVGTWNLCSPNGMGAEVCEELRKRMIDVCCLQEMRWREHGARMLGCRKGDISCGGLEKEMELVVWELWRSCMKMWEK